MRVAIVGSREATVRARRQFGHIHRLVGARGIKFRSKAEANYSFYLEWLLGLGQIAGWLYEPVTLWFTPWPPPKPRSPARKVQSHSRPKKATAWSDPRALGLTGVSRGVVSYTPDFAVDWRQRPTEKDGRSIVGGYVEVKGYMDARSSTAIARARRYFPEIRIDVVDARQMTALKRQVGGIVPNWIP